MSVLRLALPTKDWEEEVLRFLSHHCGLRIDRSNPRRRGQEIAQDIASSRCYRHDVMTALDLHGREIDLRVSALDRLRLVVTLVRG